MKQKTHKLIFQITVIILPILIAMVIFVIWAMYDSTIKSFFEVENKLIGNMFKNIYDPTLYFTDEEMDYYFGMFEKYPEEMLRPSEDEESENAEQALSDEDEYISFEEYLGGDRSFEMDEYYEWLKDAPEKVKIADAKSRYDNWYWGFSLFMNNFGEDCNGLMWLDIGANNECTVIYEILFDEEEGETGKTARNLQKYINAGLSGIPALKRPASLSKDIQFVSTENVLYDGNCYWGFKPIFLNDEHYILECIAFNWDDFLNSMNANMRMALIIGIGGLAAGIAALLIVLYLKALKPLSGITAGVTDYIDTKDSADVTAKMSALKERNELGVLAADISELARAIDRYTEENIRLAAEKERVTAELELAKDIQVSQLPCIFPAFPERTEFDLYASMNPAKEVGGDFYDFFFIDDDHFALVIADVSGKGIPAALFMMMSKIIINNFAMQGLSPGDILKNTNDTIIRNNSSKMFVTVWTGILELSTGKLFTANGGHEDPAIASEDGLFDYQRVKHNLVLGLRRLKEFRTTEIQLKKGDRIFVYTDGVPEATNADEELFGEQRLLDALNIDPKASPEELISNVRSSVDAFVKDAPQFDDLTMLCLVYNGV